jgi:transcriptional regulator with XRE-family HTH domain
MGMRTADSVDGASVARRIVIEELRRWRAKRSLTQEQLAEGINYSVDQVRSVESLRRNPLPDFLAKCDKALDTDGALSRLLPLLAEDTYPSWFRPFAEMEAQAVAIQEFEVQLVPGLLQTEEYARAVLKTGWPPIGPDEIERRLAARLERQKILHRDDPPLLSFVLDESILRRPMGDDCMMADQLQHLIDASALSHVQLQVLTFDRAKYAPSEGSYTVLEMSKNDRYVYVDSTGAGRLIPEAPIVEKFARGFDAARVNSLPVEDSIRFIAGLRRELYEHG